MSTHILTRLAASAALTLAASWPAYSQQFPIKPIRLVTSGSGGGNDVASRLVAHHLTDRLGQSVLVENRGSVVPGELVANAPPDGYTLLFGTNSLWSGTLLRKTTPYDPIKDFAPVSIVLSFPTIMAVSATLPVNSVKDFIALAKSKPAELNYVMTSTGGSAHLASELFKSLTGINMTGVAYKNAGTGIVDMVSGRVHLFFSAAGPVMPLVKSGKLKALGVTSPKPSALFPDLPTVAATVPGYEMVASYCIFAPAKTPTTIITRLNKEIVAALNTAEAKEQATTNGFEVVASSPDQLATMRKNDIARVRKVIKDAGIPIVN